MRDLKPLLALVLTLGLAACTGGNSPADSETGALVEIREAVQGSRNASDAPQVNVTRALLDGLTVASLEAVSETLDQTAYLVPSSRRGPVTIWRSADQAQLVIREGLVTGTRGIGNDLASSDYAQTIAALRAHGGTATRRLFLRNDLGGQDTLEMRCDIVDQGHVTLEVIGRSYLTHALRETCDAAGTAIVNEYWVEDRSGVIRQSRQWLGPKIGHLRLRLLKD